MMRWNVGPLLEQYGITPYRLAQEVNGKPNRNTVYALANGSLTRVDLATLDSVLKALRRLTNQPLTVGDLLQFDPEE